MTDTIRQRIFLLLIIITCGMILLAAGFPSMELNPGSPIPGADASQDTSSPSAIPSMPETRLMIKFPLAILFAVLAVLIITYFLRRIQITKILLLVGGLFIVALLFMLIDRIKLPTSEGDILSTRIVATQSTTAVEITPIRNPPAQLFSIVIIGLCLLALAIIFWLVFRASRKLEKSNPLANQADLALKAIQKGENLQNVIIRCYMEMEKILKEEEGIQRGKSLTPREFERLLGAKGVAISQIHDLTHLFEEVRYGNKMLDQSHEQVAVDCLTGIQKTFETKSAKL